ncbi:nuclear transport factor 2 family protein [Haliea sp.]
MALEAQISEIADREAIKQCLYLYCRGIDRRSPELLNKLFWPDSTVEYGIFNGGGSEFSLSICDWLEGGGVISTAHHLGNIVIALDGNSAHTESYLNAHHTIRGDGELCSDCMIGARYQDRFEKRDNEWRIVFRRLVYDWFRTFPDTFDWKAGALGVTSENATIGGASDDQWDTLNKAMGMATLRAS